MTDLEDAMGLTRRSVLIAGATAAALAAVGADPLLSPARAVTPLDDAIAEARSMAAGSYTASQVNASMDHGLEWYDTVPSAWCAWFATYIARSTGVGRVIGSADLYYNQGLPTFSSPAPGDFIYYKQAGVTDGHTGFVVGVSGTVAETVEGNTPGDPAVVKHYASPWAPSAVVGYARPAWGASPPPQNGENEMTDLIYWANEGTSPATSQGLKSPAVTVALGSMWYQECVGAPLFKIASTWDTIEWRAFSGARLNNSVATRFVTTPAAIAALIDIRGEATAPIASMAPLRT